MLLILISLGAVLLIGSAAIIPNLLQSQSSGGGGEGFTLGDPNAPVSVVNFSSFTCGHCENFSKTVEPDFVKNYIKTGNVYYRFVNLVISDDEGVQNAGKAAYCAADQNRFFDYKSHLYSASHQQDGFSPSNLVKIAETVGLDNQLFKTCLEENGTLNAAFVKDLHYAQSLGVTGTPSFLVNDQLVYANELIPLVDSLLN